MSLFADTSGLYAILDRNDANHLKAKAVWAHWLSNREALLTNNYVLLETASLLQNRIWDGGCSNALRRHYACAPCGLGL